MGLRSESRDIFTTRGWRESFFFRERGLGRDDTGAESDLLLRVVFQRVERKKRVALLWGYTGWLEKCGFKVLGRNDDE